MGGKVDVAPARAAHSTLPDRPQAPRRATLDRSLSSPQPGRIEDVLRVGSTTFLTLSRGESMIDASIRAAEGLPKVR